MLACITAQINQRSIIVAKSRKYFLDLEIFATCPKYIQFTKVFKNKSYEKTFMIQALHYVKKQLYKPANG
jgi:hypothetical protein